MDSYFTLNLLFMLAFASSIRLSTDSKCNIDGSKNGFVYYAACCCHMHTADVVSFVTLKLFWLQLPQDYYPVYIPYREKRRGNCCFVMRKTMKTCSQYRSNEFLAAVLVVGCFVWIVTSTVLCRVHFECSTS